MLLILLPMKKMFLFFLFAALFSCSKDVDELDPPTETGAGTFGAKVNGVLWAPQGFGIVSTAPILEARFGGANSIFINARNFGSSPTESEFELYIQNITGPGTFLLNQNTGKFPAHSGSYGYYVERRFTPTNEWITSAHHTGKIEVTKFDLANKIISGTFEFSALNLYGTSVPLTVSGGRFDVKIK